MTITGRITHIGQTQTFGQWTSRTLNIEESEGQYPNSLSIEFSKDNIAKLDQFKVGEVVTVEFNTRCYTSSKGGYFNSINGWRIKK